VDKDLRDLGGWPFVLSRIADGADLGEQAARLAMRDVLAGNATDAQIAAFAMGLRMKGETVNELVGLVRAMLEVAIRLQIPDEAVDIVGTGGSIQRRAHALNVSTMASFVAAAAGAIVCKHGNYRASSTSGAFDFLTALGVRVDLTPDAISACVRDLRIGFAPASRFHPAMRRAAPVRSEVGIPTVFNILGPLAHPGRPRRQLVGTANEQIAARLAEVFQRLGSEHAWVVSGAGGLDEIATIGPSVLYIATPQGVRRVELDVREVGIDAPGSSLELAGGSPGDNVRLFRAILDGSDQGPRGDLVRLNAGAALVVAGVARDLAEGIERARRAIEDGSAQRLVEDLCAYTNRI
jgi:anthranilate phosphoribosyltransferase